MVWDVGGACANHFMKIKSSIAIWREMLVTVQKTLLGKHADDGIR